MTPWAVLLSITLLLVLLMSGKIKPAIAFVSLAAGYLLVGFIDTSTLLVQYAAARLAV